MTIEQYISKVLSVAKIGLKYSKDEYALENYAELEELSLEMLNANFQDKLEENLFVRNIYPTPNVSVRVMLINENKEILFVRENDDKKWAIPGGWCDIFISPKANAIKEVSEEVGLKITNLKPLAIFFRDKYKEKTTLSEYVIYFGAEVSSKAKLDIGFEIIDTRYAKIDNDLELSTKTTITELAMAYDIYINDKAVYVD